MSYFKITIFLTINLLIACSSIKPVDQQAVENIATNPKVSQRPVSINNNEPVPGDPRFRPIRKSPIDTFQLPSGSLFNPQRAIGLYQPASHYQVGDMILVQVEEKTSADKSLKFKTDKKGFFDLQPVTLNAGPIHIADGDLNAGFEQEKEFDSSAQTKQKNSLKGDITVYVLEVLNNGNLVVAGEKWITLNTGEEFIRFSGEVRVGDISIENTISSVKVGNALIEYSSVGEMQDNQDPSLLSKIFSILE